MGTTPFQQEAWAEYSIGMVVLFVRIFARCRLVGLNWDGDDYFAVAAIFFWTAELVMLELIGQYGSITGMSDEIAVTLSQEEIDRIVIGSKCLLAGWCLYVTLIWCLKACMLFLYNRLTLNLTQHKLVKVTAIICGLGYISTIIVLLTHCHPINKLWTVYPYPGDDCALNVSKYLSLVVTNVVTDFLILYIPLPLLWKVRLPLRQKILYGAWLCTGAFIVIATLLRCIICLGDPASINLGTIWSIRETFVGIIAVNIPVLKPFFTRTFRFTTKMSSSSKDKGYTDGTRSHELSRREKRAKQGRIRDAMGLTTIGMTTNDNSSEERIVQSLDPNSKNNGVAISAASVDIEDRDPSEIHVTKAYNISNKSYGFDNYEDHGRT